MDFVQDAKGHYNLCHFWSNFELGDLRFFRSRAYAEFFNYLDRWALPLRPVVFCPLHSALLSMNGVWLGTWA